MSRPTEKRVAKWLSDLLVRIQTRTGDEKQTASLVIHFIPAFQARYQAADFDEISLNAVGGTVKFFSQANVQEALDAHLRDRAPAGFSTLPIEAQEAPFDAEGKGWVAHFFRVRGDAAERASLNMIRVKAPEVFAYLIRTHPRAENIAQWSDWFVAKPRDLAYDWDDEDVIRQKVRDIMSMPQTTFMQRIVWGTPRQEKASDKPSEPENALLTILARIVKAHAPHHEAAMLDEAAMIRRTLLGDRSVTVRPVSVAPTPFNIFEV